MAALPTPKPGKGELDKRKLAMLADHLCNRKPAPVSATGANGEADPSRRRLAKARKLRLSVRVLASHGENVKRTLSTWQGRVSAWRRDEDGEIDG